MALTQLFTAYLKLLGIIYTVMLRYNNRVGAKKIGHSYISH